MNELDYDSDTFEDIVAKDSRYDARAYALLTDVLKYLGENDRHMSAQDILDEFRETALDHFGPLTYTVLTEWGLKCTEDIGEMMFNLVESHRIGQDEGDNRSDFSGGYDFHEAFHQPYET